MERALPRCIGVSTLIRTKKPKKASATTWAASVWQRSAERRGISSAIIMAPPRGLRRTTLSLGFGPLGFDAILMDVCCRWVSQVPLFYKGGCKPSEEIESSLEYHHFEPWDHAAFLGVLPRLSHRR